MAANESMTMRLASGPRFRIIAGVMLCLVGCDSGEEPVDPPPTAFSFELNNTVDLLLTHPSSFAAADLDADGDLDFVAATAQQQILAVILQTRPAQFSASIVDPGVFQSGCCFSDITLADFDLDGLPDAAAGDAISGGGVHMLRNTGAGRFAFVHYRTTVPEDAGVYAVEAVDVTANGRPDVVLSREYGRTALFYVGEDGRLRTQQEIVGGLNGFSTRMELATGDFNGDDHVDVAHVSPNGVRFSLLRGEGATAALLAQTEIPLPFLAVGLAPSDFDNDGDLDLASVHADERSLSLAINQGDGIRFETKMISLGEKPSAIAAADLDRDGDADLAVADTNAGILYLLENQGGLQFELAHTLELDGRFLAGRAPDYHIIPAHLNGDDLIDLVISSSFTATAYVYLNRLSQP